MDPQKPGTWEGPVNPPPSLEDTILCDGTSRAGPTGGTPGHGFLMEFTSVGEFLSFAHTEMEGPGTSLSLVEDSLSARELELAAWEEKRQAAEDMVLIA